MSFDIINCAGCGVMFASRNGGILCRKCLEKEDQHYVVVRKYVRDHPGASVLEVSEATCVEEKIIMRLLEAGRLHSDGFVELVNCERCGKAIVEGRFCPVCLAEVNKELQSVLQPVESKVGNKINYNNNKMHIRTDKS